MSDKLSTACLSAFPSPEVLKKRCVVIAILEMIMDPDNEPRESYFVPDWSAGEQAFIWDNMSGDFLNIGFCDSGVFIKGFDHERNDLSIEINKYYEGVPDELQVFKNEPAFRSDNTSYCIWWHKGWHTSTTCADSPVAAEISEEHLELLNFNPSSFIDYANCLYDLDISKDQLEPIYRGETLTADLVMSLNSEANFPEVLAFSKLCFYGES